jgi:hypothetical protein
VQDLGLVGLELFLKSDVLIKREVSFTGLSGNLVAKIILFAGCLHVLLGLEHLLESLALQTFIMVLVKLS